MKFKINKSIFGWALYDWANSAFATTVMAGFFPIFFKQYWSTDVDVNVSTAMLGYSNSIASLLVAILAPFLGAIADKGSSKKKFLFFFAYLGVLMTSCLYLVGEGNWIYAVIIYSMGIIGFSGANIFYDSLLPSLSNETNIDSISSFGYALGYLGGGILFSINVIMTLKPEFFFLKNTSEAVKVSFLTVAIWWGIFTLFILFWVKEPYLQNDKNNKNSLVEGFYQIKKTLIEISHLKTVLLFLIAYWFYIDGVDTIVRMSVDYGLSIGFKSTDLITALLLVQFVGFPSALFFGWIGKKWGVKKSIFLAILIYILITIWGMQMQEELEFYLLAALIGIVQGGIQALSRSFYARIIPKNRAGEFFGFFNMFGKFAVILGPALMGSVGLIIKNLLITESTKTSDYQMLSQEASRLSLGSIIILFIVGGIFLFFVDEKKGKLEAKYLENI